MEKKYDIVCVGFAVLDVIMGGIDKGALERDSTHASSTVIASGGDAANQAAVLSKLGKKTALAVRLGRDSVGEQIYRILEKKGVDMTYCSREGIQQSVISIAVVKPDGERSFLVGKPEGNTDISMDTLDVSFLDLTKAVSIGSLYFLRKMDQEGAAWLFSMAKRKKVITFADMTADAYQIGPRGVEAVYPYTDYLMPSYEEAYYVSGKTKPEEMADFFLEKGVGNVIIKLGKKGCFTKNAKTCFYTNPYKIEPIDTTGCGDNFCAGLISGILDGKSLEESVLFGSAAGAINAACMGAAQAVKSKEQIEGFMRTTMQFAYNR